MKTPLPALARVAGALLLGAALFQGGREVGRLEGLAEGPKVRKDAGNEMVASTYRGAPEPAPAEAKPAVTVGDPVGAKDEVITPLNVRDPSALVMGPGGGEEYRGCPPPPALPPVPAPSFKRSEKPAKPLPEGRLLELLKKKESTKELDVPKSY